MDKSLNLNMIKEYAPARALERGREYYELNLVHHLTENKGIITARVKGNRDYRVRLRMEVEGDLDYSCTCPMGDEGEFCKHCVATALAWINRQDGNGKNNFNSVTLNDVKDYLQTLDKRAMVDILLEQAQEDESLWKKLCFEAARKAAGEFSKKAWMQMIRQAFEVDEFVNYYQMPRYTENISNLVDAIESLLEDGYAPEVIGLVEYALQQAGIALNSIDDSDGEMGDILYRLQEIHFAACQQAKPNPEELAARLFDLELNSEWDIFYGAAKTYAPILGEKGIAVYRRLAREKWAKIENSSSKREFLQTNSLNTLNLIEIMETLAELSGDIEEMVEIKKRDLSHAYNYLEIAEIYKKAGNKDKALEWAQAGMKAFPNRTDARLREFLANEYYLRKRHEEALNLIWNNFQDHLSLEKYQSLKLHADKVKQWLPWREKAFDLIRQNIAAGKKNDNRWGYLSGHSLPVEIFLWEKNVEAAWREAKEGGCTRSLWMKLAALREKDHPLDAVEVYKNNVDWTVSQTNNKAYEEALKLIRKIQVLMNQINQDASFAAYLLELRTKYKAKRNFMKLLEKIK